MGMLSGGFFNQNVSSGVVTLSGQAFITSDDGTSPYDSRSGIRANLDGTIDTYSYNGSTLTINQIDTGTDWIIPNGDADSLYEFQLDVTSNAPNYQSDSTGSYIFVGAGAQSANYLQWVFQRTIAGSTDWNWTLRVRRNGGAEIDNAAYFGTVTAGI